MAEINSFKNGKILCPNHGEPLEGIPKPMPDKGGGRCPVSKCMFSFEVNPDKVKYARTADGGMVKVPWVTLTGDDSK